MEKCFLSTHHTSLHSALMAMFTLALAQLPDQIFVPMSRVGENLAINRSYCYKPGMIHIYIDLKYGLVTEMVNMVVTVSWC
jgi:hypothetical protein